MLKILILSTTILLLLTSCQYFADRSDKEAIRKQCRIPKHAKLIDFQGFPWMNGFGQREGLHLSARYKLEESDRADFIKNSKDEGWESLPISAEIREKIPPGKSRLNLDLDSGLFRCHYAGDNALYAEETQPCYFTLSGEFWGGSTKRRLNDMILSIYDQKTGEISAEIFSFY